MPDVNHDRTARVGWWSRVATARPGLSLLLALAFVVLAVVAGRGVADRMGSGGWQAPGSESAYASAELDRHFPRARPNLLLMVRARREGDAPAGAPQGGRPPRPPPPPKTL